MDGALRWTCPSSEAQSDGWTIQAPCDGILLGYQMKAARFPAHRDRAVPETAHNVVFIGGSGTGKTHPATALGVQAIQCHGKRVRFRSNI